MRGISTLGILNTATYPLIVIDNFQMDERFDINSINPNDVESITILKDAVATSMYGTRGANGVIVIAMKKGRFNQPLRVSVSSMITIEEKPDLFYFPQITPSDFIGIEEYLFNNGYYDSYLNDLVSYPEISTAVEIMARRRAGLISETDAKSQIDNLRKFDLRKELKKNVYRNAARQQHYLSFGGGTNNLSYQISFGYNHNLNNIQGSRPMDQYTFASSANFKPVKNLEIQVSLQLSRSKDRSYTFNLPSSASPYDRLADENGNALAISNAFRKEYLDTVGGGSLMNWSYRPLDEIHLADNERVSNFSRLSLGLIYNLTPWLNTAVNFGFTTTNTNIRNYLSMEAWEARNLINLYTNFTETDPNLRYPIPKEGILDLNNDLSLRYDLRGTINLNKTWRNQHQLTALLGAEISEANGYGNGQRLYGYNRNNGTYRTDIDYYNYYPLSYIYAGYTNGIPSSNYFREQPFNRFVSILGNASYSFNDKYYLYASARRDGANIFGVNTNNRWKPLWSVGASWYLSKEDFFELNWIQSLKIRASYGYTGNVNNQLSGKYTIIYGTPAQFTNLPAASNGDAFNPDLKWEEVRIFNVGLDFAILKNKISGSIDLFQKRSKDVLANLPLDPTVGINVYPVNYASLNTKGFDVLLSSKNNIGALEWTTSFGFSYAKSVVSEVYNRFGYRANDFTSFSLNATPGQIAFGLSSFKWGGLDPATGDPIGFLNGVASTDYSAILMDSIQHQLFHGSQIPLYSGFIRNNFSWKGISLSMNITGRFNFYFRQPALNLEYSSVIGSNNYMYDYYIRWQKPGDELVTTVPSMIYPASSATSLRNAFYKYAEIHVRRGDNIRIQDIRLAYQCINKRKSKLPIKDAQFFVYPNNLNLIIWRAEKTYFDPDFSGVATDATAAPTPKTWTVGVMVSL